MAKALHAKWATGLNGGMVIANPIPHEFAMPEETINSAIAQAVREADEQGINGKASTPFLLARVAELTGGNSVNSILSWCSITRNWLPVSLPLISNCKRLTGYRS